METFTDPRDGETYRTVQIGNLIWLAESLRYLEVDHRFPNRDSDNISRYGCLYIWGNAMKACPPGWRLPTKEEFEELLKVDGAGSSFPNIRDSSWNKGSNSTGFGALPAGHYYKGSIYSFGFRAAFWSATKINSSYAYSLDVVSHNAEVGISLVDYCAFSIRCVKGV